MKKKYGVLALFVVIIIAIIFFVVYRNSRKEPVIEKAKVMIRLTVINKSGEDLKSLKFGTVINDNERHVSEDVDLEKIEDRNKRAFLIGYRANTDFYFEYSFEEDEEARFYDFNVNDMTDIYNEQKRVFEINEEKEIEVKE